MGSEMCIRDRRNTMSATSALLQPTGGRTFAFVSERKQPSSIRRKISNSLSNLLAETPQPKAAEGLRDALEEFLDASDLCFSAHINRAAAMVEKLPWVTAEGSVKPNAAEVYANVARSLEVFEQCAAAKSELSYRGKEVVQALEKRAELYAADSERVERHKSGAAASVPPLSLIHI